MRETQTGKECWDKERSHNMKESVIQKGICDWLGWQEKKLGIYWFRANSGAMKLESGRFMKTGRPGLPDICAIKEGVFYGLEVKTAKGKQSQSQKYAEEQIKQAGGQYHVVRSIADVKEIMG